MSSRFGHALDEVLGLPVEERSAIAAALVDRLEGEGGESVSAAWRQELHRRREAQRSGASRSIAWAEVRA